MNAIKIKTDGIVSMQRFRLVQELSHIKVRNLNLFVPPTVRHAIHHRSVRRVTADIICLRAAVACLVRQMPLVTDRQHLHAIQDIKKAETRALKIKRSVLARLA